MKITRSNELVAYTPGGHYDVRAQRIHNKEISGTEMLTVGLSWFLPGGRADANVTAEGCETVYYIVEGEMTLEANGETTLLKAGDSALFKTGDVRAVRNDSSRPTAMMVISARRPVNA